MDDSSDIWATRYGHVCPPGQGYLVNIEGMAGKDTYNPALFEGPGGKVLAFRAERRESDSHSQATYHPAVHFATATGSNWFASGALPSFDMVEDPFFFYVFENGRRRVVFGVARLVFDGEQAVPQTELYKGDTLGSLDRMPFVTVANMKNVRFRQLPDGRYLMCRRPIGNEYGEGRITAHIIDNLEDVNNPILIHKPLAILDSGTDMSDWVGINNIYLIQSPTGEAWVGLLGHVALRDSQGNLHYAASTYRISLQNLLDSNISAVPPNILATRDCFAPGPAKSPKVADVVFPGHLEQIDSYRYRLWAGLSDASIGCLEVDDPFSLR